MKILRTSLVYAVAFSAALVTASAKDHEKGEKHEKGHEPKHEQGHEHGHAQPQMPRPTEQHKLLHADVGTWVGEMRMYPGGPDADPVVSPAKEVNRLMDGGFWILTDFESGPYKGFGQFGYDPAKKKYVGTWTDNVSPTMGIMKGDYDKDAKKMVMFMTGVDHNTGKPTRFKTVTKAKNEDTREFSMYQKNEGAEKWAKVFDISYTRKK